ncbi:MAG: ATP-binding cassette domain-containing protein [Corynebacterium sp.]|nr:ATP-binding cassette domain-containing protein [Corynebacterium sp.]
MSILRCDNASLHPLWSGLNFTVSAGEFLTVIGDNGTGKTSLLAAILGSRPLSSGHITVEGRIGYIPQQRMFGPEGVVRAYDLVSLSLAHGIVRGRRASKQAVCAALQAADAVDFAQRRVHSLSGGQQQRIRQAQAFANKPDILLCDEPLLSLDIEHQKATVERICRYQQETGAAVVFVTHSVAPVLDKTDKMLLLNHENSLYGTPAAVLEKAGTPYLQWEGICHK